MIRAATDVGGTFTDFAAYDDATKSLIIAKASTKQTIIEAIGDCFAKSGVKPAQLDHFAHGNTVAINIVIEKKGAKTGLITTAGFRDVLEIARGNIPNSFDLMFQTPEPLVPRHLRKEIAERLTVGGKVHTPVDRAEAQATIQSLVDENVEVDRDLLSSRLCQSRARGDGAGAGRASQREIVRHRLVGFVAPVPGIRADLDHGPERLCRAALRALLRRSALLPRQGVVPGQRRGHAVEWRNHDGRDGEASARPLDGVGPVGGTIAAAHIAKNAGFDNVVAFDMGGTTAKVSIVRNGNVEIADGYTIGPPDMGYPMQLPVVDILEVGSGGGSIAHLDETGLLKVGPVSAGAYPGPACYARGGDQPTVTDADVVLGRLNPDFFLGGEIKLDVARATAAIEKVVAKALGISTIKAASGIARVTDADMAHAVRIMTVQKGHDPRDFVLVAFGGAGPAHAIAIARELGIGKVVIPRHPGIFSAIGMLLADAREDNVLSYVETLDRLDLSILEVRFGEIETKGIDKLRQSGFAREDIVASRSLEMRYVGQEFTLIVPLAAPISAAIALADLRKQFDALHDARYGHAFAGAKTEIVSLRSHVLGLLAKPELGRLAATVTGGGGPIGARQVYFEETGFIDCPVYRREKIGTGTEISGPAVIEEVMSLTVIYPGDRCRPDGMGNLVIDVAGAAAKSRQ